MKIRPKDREYEDNQLYANMCHLSGALENDSDVWQCQKVLADVAVHKPRTFLEVGTRTGLLPLKVALAHPEIHVYGVDTVSAFLDIANTRCDKFHLQDKCLRLYYCEQDMHDLSSHVEVGYVCSIGVLEHSHNPKLALSEIFRVCHRRVYLEIDLAHDEKYAGSHYTTETQPEDWLSMLPKDHGFDLRWVRIGNTLTIEGTK